MNKSYIVFAISSLRKNIFHTFLTTFGIMIGIAMVVIVLSAGYGIKNLILNEISSFGNNWINIEVKIPSSKKNSSDNANELASGVTITTLVPSDLEALYTIPDVTSGYAGVTTQGVLSYAQEKKRPTIFGVSHSYLDVTNALLADGRFFSEEENQSAAQVVVLGAGVRETLFGNANPLQKIVKIDGKGYTVIGVMEELGATGFFNMDDLVYIPVKTAQKKIMGIDHVLWMVVEVEEDANAANIAEEITAILRDRHDITDPDKDDFAVTTLAEATAIVGTIVAGITWLLVALAAISLLVGGVGIMNVMYVSVVERTFEIGLRKAVGATKKDILRQFLLEAIVLTGLGGLIGILFGSLISLLIYLIANALGFSWAFRISLFSIVLSFVFSTAVGLFFGLYPARKAADMDAIVALRQE